MSGQFNLNLISQQYLFYKHFRDSSDLFFISLTAIYFPTISNEALPVIREEGNQLIELCRSQSGQWSTDDSKLNE